MLLMTNEETPDELLRQAQRAIVEGITSLTEKAAQATASERADNYASAARQLAETRAWLLGKH